MKHEILPNGNLKLTCDPEDMVALRAMESAECFDSDEFLTEFMEHLVCNTELDWARPKEVGALTDAPILAIWGQDRALREGEEAGWGNREVGRWGKDGKLATWVQDAEQCWGWMSYQVQSLQQELLEHGEAVLQKGFET